ncbi:hypothetical protein ANMWB30_24590 [Arthrobacter sp. MWB30]|nr:hypothetical protein ANMWB30_24590 [Arthrobacter sp. MWB30]
MSPRKNAYDRAVNDAAAFNKRHPSGTPVRFWPGMRQGPGLTSTTRGEAWALYCGDAVVKVHGRAGGIYLTHIEVITDPDCPVTQRTVNDVAPSSTPA